MRGTDQAASLLRVRDKTQIVITFWQLMATYALTVMLLLFPGNTSYTRGDDLFSDMQYQQAIGVYEEALGGADSAKVFWRLARASICLADVSPEQDRSSLYKAAESYARRSIRADSLNDQGDVWLAAALGNIAMSEGASTKVHLCREIKECLDTALQLNPNDDVALSILGSFYRALGNVSWFERRLAGVFLGGLPSGGYEDAEHAFLRAIQIAPDRIRNHDELGLLYLDMKRPKEALAEFQKVLTLPIAVASDRAAKERAAESIKDLNGES